MNHFHLDKIHTKCDFKIVFNLFFSYHRPIPFETRFLRLDQLVNAGNLRVLTDSYVTDLLAEMVSSGIDPAYPIQVMAPDPNGEEHQYRIINGQHRFRAAQLYFDRMNPIIGHNFRLINCQIYSNITVAQETVIAANPSRVQKPDENNVTFRRCVLYLDWFRLHPNDDEIRYSDEQFGRIYSTGENVTGGWRRQCLRAVKFPCVYPERAPLHFLNLQLRNVEYTITGMTNARVNGNDDPSLVYFSDIGRDVVERLPENNFLNVGGYLSHLHQQIMFDRKGYTMSGYAIIYNTICNGIIKYLYPTQIIAIFEDYRQGLEGLEYGSAELGNYNKMFTGFLANIYDVFGVYLRSLINDTNVLPTLPEGWSYPENFRVNLLNTADLYQIFLLLMDPSDILNVKAGVYKIKQNKNVHITTFFTGNVGEVIRSRWIALFRNPEAVVTPLATDVFGVIPTFKREYETTKGGKYTLKFFNSCVFAFCSRAKANGVKYNLVLGDLPVSLI
jgi:hypothetical protein